MWFSRFISVLSVSTVLFLISCSEGPKESKTKSTPEKATAVTNVVSSEKKVAKSLSPKAIIETKQLRTLKVGEGFIFKQGNQETLLFTIEEQRTDSKGLTFLTGSHKGDKGTSRLTATAGESVTYGRIQTPETTYTFTIRAGNTTIVDLGAEGNRLVPKHPDDAILPTRNTEPNKSKSEASQEISPPKAYAAPSVDGKTTIDLMIVYSDGFAAEHPGDAAITRLNHLVSVANTIYSNSNIDIYLRLVHTVQISYPDDTTNGSALDDITDGVAGFSTIEALRDHHGADLVSLVRPYDRHNQNGCGVAFLLGTRGLPIEDDAANAYSVISDGSEQDGQYTYFCSEQTLTHELGHNMGSAHDRAHAQYSGIYSYSYGYGINGNFGTVMSYIDPEVDYFSNPSLTCDAGPPAIACGIDESQSNSANNTLSINNTASSVATFAAAKYSADIDGNGDINVTDTIKALKLLTDQSISGDIDAIEDINGDGRLGLQEAIHSLQKSK